MAPTRLRDPDAITETDPFVRHAPARVVRAEAPLVAAVAAGGAVGAAARHGLQLCWPTPVGAFPWTTLFINVSGCALMGVVMVAITELWVGHRLLRPFVGTGILGGYTTFSTFAGDVDALDAAHSPLRALLYLVATPVAALTVTWTAATAARRVLLRRRG